MNWGQLAYQYIVGGLFFLITLRLCFRPGAASLKNPSDRRAFAYLVIGFIGYLALHAGWIFFAST